MENTEWGERCGRISNALLTIEDNHPYAESMTALMSFIGEIAGEREAMKPLQERKINTDPIDNMLMTFFDCALSFGYVIGQMFDLPYSEAQKDIDAIKAVIREKGLLTVIPRERGCHEEKSRTIGKAFSGQREGRKNESSKGTSGEDRVSL